MIPAKKSLGQNFLKSKEALRALVEAGNVGPEDVILEVGPGKGVLTEELVKRAKRVIAVEKDHRLIEDLNARFKEEIAVGKLEVVEGDILEFDPGRFGGEKYKIIANIPYYITGTFLQKFLESDFQPTRMVLMVQKEVADRIVARDPKSGQASGKESILSISVKAYGTPKYVMMVKAKYFSPRPKVDSAIILIENISKQRFQTVSEKDFFKIVKAGFAHKRKMLASNLKEIVGEAFNNTLGGALESVSLRPPEADSPDTSPRSSMPTLGGVERREEVTPELSGAKRRASPFKASPDNSKAPSIDILISCGINEKARAEDLSLSDWFNLVSKVVQ